MFVYLQKLLHCLITYSYKTNPLFFCVHEICDQSDIAILRKKVSLKETEAKLQAENEATQKLLDEERKAAIVDAEVKALEKIESDSKQGSLLPLDIDAPVNRTQYTARYISDHS